MFLSSTQLDTCRTNTVPDNLKATMTTSQCTQLDSQLASGALVAVWGEPPSLVEYASSDCVCAINVSVASVTASSCDRCVQSTGLPIGWITI